MMTRSRRLLIYGLLAIAALVVGRFVQTPSPVILKPKQEVPDNIDFYLAGVDYRAMNEQGRLGYRLQTPLLEHYRREDVSRVRQPRIEYRLPQQRWRLQAEQGELRHREDRLLLERGVRLQRDGDRPMRLDTEQLQLYSVARIATLPLPLVLQTPRLRLEADSARLQLDNGRYRFDGVRAVHQPPEAES